MHPGEYEADAGPHRPVNPTRVVTHGNTFPALVTRLAALRTRPPRDGGLPRPHGYLVHPEPATARPIKPAGRAARSRWHPVPIRITSPADISVRPVEPPGQEASEEASHMDVQDQA